MKQRKANATRREPSAPSVRKIEAFAASPSPWRKLADSPFYRALATLFLLGMATHFIGLTSPRQVVFDEVHMGKFVTSYCCTGKRFFDVHPPHGKLLIALGTKLGGYTGLFPFEKIGQPYLNEPLFFFRVVPAISGVLLAPLFFILLGYLGASLPAAFLGGLIVLFENAILLETRILVFDGILLAATLSALIGMLAADRAKTRRSARLWNILCGASAGLALGTKFTGLTALALISVYFAVRVAAHRDWIYFLKRFKQWALICASASVIYVGGWAIHFALLPNPGVGDAFHATTGHFVEDFMVSHERMLTVNYNLDKSHPDASAPWTWPLMKIAPYYWAGDGAYIYLFGNPVVWWGGSLLFFSLLITQLLMKVTRLKIEGSENSRSLLWLTVAGYFISFVPLWGVKRVLFLYHYLTPLLFSLMFVLLWLDRAGWIRSSRLGSQRRSYYVVIACVVLGFLLISPLTYGFSVGRYDDWLAGLIRSFR